MNFAGYKDYNAQRAHLAALREREAPVYPRMVECGELLWAPLLVDVLARIPLHPRFFVAAAQVSPCWGVTITEHVKYAADLASHGDPQPLCVAAALGGVGAVQYILAGMDGPSSLRVGTSESDWPLYAAVKYDRLAVFTALMHTGGAFPSYIGPSGFDVAMQYEREEMLQLLLRAAPFSQGHSALHIAAQNGKTAMCLRLIRKHGVAVDTPLTTGRTPLHLAAESGWAETCRALIDAGAQVSAADYVTSVTPLHLAAFNGRVAVCVLLLDAGAHVWVRDGEGTTPLHFAVHGRSLPTCELLLARGANPLAKNSKGATPLSFASAMGRGSIRDLLAAAAQRVA